MVALTENAVKAIRRAMGSADESAAGLRIMVQQGGCSGLRYMMGLDSTAMDGDAVFECGGVTVYVDRDSAPMLTGASVDYIDSLDGSGFVFDNPNARDTCSCGKSFAC